MITFCLCLIELLLDDDANNDDYDKIPIEMCNVRDQRACVSSSFVLRHFIRAA